MFLSAGREITLGFFTQIKSGDDFMELPRANPRDLMRERKEFKFKIIMPVQIRRADLLDPLEMIFVCGIFRSCLKIRIFVRDLPPKGWRDKNARPRINPPRLLTGFSTRILKYVEDLIRGLNADIG